jgi:FkbM family methyltransferase
MEYKVAPQCQIVGLNELYAEYFGENLGTFVEVGAYDGLNFSNTWGLAEAGWKGVYVEPVPEHVALCRKNHENNNVEVLSCACGAEAGSVTIHVAGPLSTYDETYLNSETWHREYAAGRLIKVPLVPLDDILQGLKIKNNFEVLVIDTEGSELEVLKGVSLWHWQPQMIIIEAHEHSPFKELSTLVPAIEEYLKDYVKIYSDEINNIYVRKDHK